MVKYISCDFKYKFNNTTCNLNQKLNNKTINVNDKSFVSVKKIIVGILAHASVRKASI